MFSIKIKLLIALLVGGTLIGCGSSKTSDNSQETQDPPLEGSTVVATFKTLYEYSPFIKPLAGIGYAVYQNDGEFNTGLVMTVLNPEGTILKNQQYEISLLQEMQGTLLDMQNQLNEIGSQLDSILLEIGLAKAEILTNINDPSEHIVNISTVNESLYLLAQKYDPHNATQAALQEQSDSILSPNSKYHVLGELNQIHDAVTAKSAGKEAVLSTFTDALILKLGSSPTSSERINAYKALEYYTMQLIGAEIQATNLLVDASLYQDDNQSAKYYYEKLDQNLNDFFNTNESYSFTNNALRLTLRYSDNYYDKPDESGTFFANRSEEIFERMAFLKALVLQEKDKNKIIIYRVSENNDENLTFFTAPSAHTFPTSVLRCEEETSSPISVGAYDHWSLSELGEMELDLVNTYTLTQYTCPRVFEGMTNYIIDAGLNVVATLSPKKYNDGMKVSDEGEYLFGFAAIAQRESAGFEELSWSECHGKNYLRDTFYDNNERFLDNRNCFLDVCDYDAFLKDPLDKIFMKTKCQDLSHQTLYDIHTLNSSTQDCEVSDSQVYNMITMCSDTFTYTGEDDSDFTIDTRLDRSYLADAKHSFATDGTIKLGAGLFFEDISSGDIETIYEKVEKNEVQGEEYTYSDAQTFDKKVSLNTGHKYRLVVQMAAKIDQGTNTTRGFVSMEIEKKRKIRFIYP